MRIAFMLLLGIAMAGPGTYSQTLIDPRANALGGSSAVIHDVRGFALNPAGLAGVKDWDLSVTTYLTADAASAPFVFHGISIGKRFLDRHVLALQYSPGTSLQFAFPPELIIGEGNLPASIERTVTYDERFALGYAAMPAEDLNVGIDARNRREQLSEAVYKIGISNGTSFPTVERKMSSANLWDFDAAVRWTLDRSLTLTAVGRNLFHIRGGEEDSLLDGYQLPHPFSAEVGAVYSGWTGFLLTGMVTTALNAALGAEWTPGLGLALRSGLYVSNDEVPALYAIGFGAGWSYRFFGIDISYLLFSNTSHRTGTSNTDRFNPSQFTSLDLNTYTQNRLSISARAVFGDIRDKIMHIEGVEITGAVYPAGAEAFAYTPIGRVRVKNVSSKPAEVTVGFQVDRFMDRPTESQPVRLTAGEEAEIPFLAFFNEQIQQVSALAVYEGSVFVRTTRSDDFEDKYPTRIVVHGRNAWDGSPLSLRHFVRPDDPAILKYSRDILLEHKDSLSSVPQALESFTKARLLLNAFAGKLIYVNDPKLSSDYVQYPSETLQIRGGDCDDMTVCFASLLSSIGLSTAFVDVVPPDRPEASHIFLLFDTGLDSHAGSALSTNPKRYVVRRNKEGRETLWIPIESTVVSRGFEESWTNGAQSYYDAVEVGLGLVKGWVRIVDAY